MLFYPMGEIVCVKKVGELKSAKKEVVDFQRKSLIKLINKFVLHYN